ncbi:hypothetical protein VNO77_22558 [Canavalia gladiata]|uniref:Uncharacterized protein n=1 Tax=Canavalia gladiata TaxID=3824 RepID=A0AAN9L303_CANGL
MQMLESLIGNVMGTCSHAHGTVGAEGLPLGHLHTGCHSPMPPTMGLTHWAQSVGVKASLPLWSHPTHRAFIGPHHSIPYSGSGAREFSSLITNGLRSRLDLLLVVGGLCYLCVLFRGEEGQTWYKLGPCSLVRKTAKWIQALEGPCEAIGFDYYNNKSRLSTGLHAYDPMQPYLYWPSFHAYCLGSNFRELTWCYPPNFLMACKSSCTCMHSLTVNCNSASIQILTSLPTYARRLTSFLFLAYITGEPSHTHPNLSLDHVHGHLVNKQVNISCAMGPLR